MKKITSIAAVAALIFAFGCTEEPLDKDPQEGGNPEGEVPAEGFYLKANIGQNADTQLSGTKTTFDAQNGYKVEWEERDELAVYIKGGETDGLYKFTKNAGGNTFSTEGFIPDADTDYTYYVVYPFTETVSDSEDLTAQVTIASGTYDAADPDGNIDTPMYGKTQGAGAECPEVTLSHLASVIAVEFVNETGADLTVTEVSIEAADVALSDTFSLDLETGDITSDLVVPLGTVLTVNAAAGESAVYYLACAPYTGALTVNVAADKVYSEEKEAAKFDPGKFYETVVTAGAGPVLPETIETLSISGAAAGETPVAIEKTLENDALYAWKGDLQAGEFRIKVNGTDAFLSVADANFEGTPSTYGISFDGGSYTIAEAGSYRIIVDTEAGTIEVRDEEHDLPVRYANGEWANGTVAGYEKIPAQNTVEIECLWIYGPYNSFVDDSGVGDGFEFQYRCMRSQANPNIFVYSGEELPRVARQGNAGGASKYMTGGLVFVIGPENPENGEKFTNSEIRPKNSSYAFGSADANSERNIVCDSFKADLDTQYDLREGQDDSRYDYFEIPEGCNYILVNTEDMKVIFKHVETAAGN